MKKTLILFIIFAAGILSVFLVTKYDDTAKKNAVVGLDAPGFELKDTEGKVWKLSALKGKVVFLNFWASWCDSCKEENPSIQKLINAEKGNDAFVFVSILYKDDPLKAKDYMEANGLDFPVLIDNKNTAREYGIKGIPETFILNRKGIIKGKVVGPQQWDAPDIRAAIRKLINSDG
jgi:peroxiredoxin